MLLGKGQQYSGIEILAWYTHNNVKMELEPIDKLNEHRTQSSMYVL